MYLIVFEFFFCFVKMSASSVVFYTIAWGCEKKNREKNSNNKIKGKRRFGDGGKRRLGEAKLKTKNVVHFCFSRLFGGKFLSENGWKE